MTSKFQILCSNQLSYEVSVILATLQRVNVIREKMGSLSFHDLAGIEPATHCLEGNNSTTELHIEVSDFLATLWVNRYGLTDTLNRGNNASQQQPI